ncbi:MAG: RHS repeat-associated core domain-containing protein [Deltaproteobacteria bacterium]|nr:RHS repeat-associated core domain-containing protein [Deltaproteobacteria bacterium]
MYAPGAHTPDYLVRDGAAHRVIVDPLGSPVLIVDALSGAIAQVQRYDAFGVVIADSAPGFQSLGFAGGLHDETTGLVRFGARDYDPTIGRFLRKDPIRFEGGDPNLYTYVGSDPINVTDPSGLLMPQASIPAPTLCGSEGASSSSAMARLGGAACPRARRARRSP